MDVIAGVFYCLGFYILLVCDPENVLFFYSCKRIFLQSHLLFQSSSQGEGASHDPDSRPRPRHGPRQFGSLPVLGSPMPSIQHCKHRTSASWWHCGHCVISPGGLSSKAHDVFHRVPLSKVKNGILNFILNQATK